MNTNKSVALVMMLDHSASMENDLTMVKIDAKAFIRCAAEHDQFGVNQFSNKAEWLYPSGEAPQLVTVGAKKEETLLAANAIETIKLGDMTNMGGAFLLAEEMIKQATADKKAFVLLSDGYHNVGPQPIDCYKGDVPLLVAGLGHYVDRKYFEALLKKNPKSKMYWKPSAFEMMTVFNEIRGESTGAAVLANKVDEYAGCDYQLVNVDVSEDSEQMQFLVVWSDAHCKYTSGTPEGFNINVYLIDDKGQQHTDAPDVTGDGFCIFNRKNVKAGTWRILVQYAVAGSLHVSGTVGCFQPDSKIRLQADIPAVHVVGEPLVASMAVWDGNDKLNDISAEMRVVRPLVSQEHIHSRYMQMKEEMESGSNKDMAVHAACLESLRDEQERSVGSSVHFLSDAASNGDLVGNIADTEIPGTYDVEWVVSGVNPRTGKKFSFVKSATVLVVEK